MEMAEKNIRVCTEKGVYLGWLSPFSVVRYEGLARDPQTEKMLHVILVVTVSGEGGPHPMYEEQKSYIYIYYTYIIHIYIHIV